MLTRDNGTLTAALSELEARMLSEQGMARSMGFRFAITKQALMVDGLVLGTKRRNPDLWSMAVMVRTAPETIDLCHRFGGALQASMKLRLADPVDLKRVNESAAREALRACDYWSASDQQLQKVLPLPPGDWVVLAMAEAELQRVAEADQLKVLRQAMGALGIGVLRVRAQGKHRWFTKPKLQLITPHWVQLGFPRWADFYSNADALAAQLGKVDG